MKTRVKRAYFFIPLIYILVIFLLLFLQFSKGQVFSERREGLLLRGVREVNNGEQAGPLERIQVRYRGIAFIFDSTSSLGFETEEGELFKAKIESYESLPDGFKLSFSNNIHLIFEITGDSQSDLQIRTSLPENIKPLQSIRIPFEIENGAKIKSQIEEHELAVQSKEDLYILGLSNSSRFHLGEEKEILIAGADKDRPIYYLESIEETIAEVSWYSRNDLNRDDETYRASVNVFIDKAYQGWKNGRYNAEVPGWILGPDYVFAESIITAFLAEAWKRDEYQRAHTEMRSAADAYSGELSYRSVVFLGNMNQIWQDHIVEDQLKAGELRSEISAKDPSLFRRENVVAFAADRAGVLEELLNYIEHVDLQSIDLFSSIGLLDTVLTVNSAYRDRVEALYPRFRILIDDIILPSIQEIEEGFFIDSGEGSVNLFWSIKAGKVLLEAGKREENDILAGLGQRLILSALNMSDENAIVPREMRITESVILEKIGYLGPEEFYPLLSDNPHYPRQISLSQELGRPAWIWTVVPFSRIDINSSRYAFSIENSPQITHYISFIGVPPFDRMELFGVIWRNDPQFEFYRKGRYYNQNIEVLMVKYHDEDPSGDIVLYY